MAVLDDWKREQLYDRKGRIYVLSYGGGVNSSALFFHIIEKNYPLDLVIFADTGNESKETMDTVKEMMLLCIKKGISFQKVYSKYVTEFGSLNEYYFQNNAVPMMRNRDCTSKFKISPIRKHIRMRYGKAAKFVMYIGIAYDEMTRVRTSNVKYIEHCYPFVYDKIDRKGNIKILEKYNFKAAKSGCVGCIFLKKSQWIDMIKNDNDEFQKWARLDTNKYGVLYNNQYNLKALEKKVKEQTTLDFLFEEPEQTCDSIHGGCMR